MDNRKHNQIDSWDDGVYGTGNTMPPKSHSGLVALLLILVIFLSGIISALSFLNIRLFQQLSRQTEQQDQVPMSFSAPGSSLPPGETTPQAPAFREKQDISLSLDDSPQSVDNIPQEGGLSLQEIYEQNIPSVVSISCSTQTETNTGSGVILSDRGYIVTNYHVVRDAETITVRLTDDRIFTALLVGADRITDLAVIYVDAPDLQAAQFGSSASLRVGDAVAAIGDPLGGQLSGSMTNGIVSAVNRNVLMNGLPMELIQTNAALNPGNSGGPLINCYGQVIGINSLKAVGESGADGIAFAIPSTTVKQIVDQLISQGYISGRPTLGMTGESVTQFDQFYFHIPAGLYLTQIDDHSSAALQGLEPGDILISLDGTAVFSQGILDTIVFQHAISDTLEAVIFRNGSQYTLTLTVTEEAG